MRFTVSKSALSRTLATITKAVSSSSDKPILGGILIEAGDGTIVMQSTDMNTSIRHSLPANVEEDGATVVSGKLMASIVKNLPDSAIYFSSEADSMVVTCEKSKFRLRTLDPVDFPGFPEVVPAQTVELPFDLMAKMVDKVHKMVSKDNSRPILAGILLTVGDGELRLVATDSYRLAVCDTRVQTEESFEAIIPGIAIHQVMSLQTMEEAVSIGTSENQVIFSSGNTTYVTRRIEGSFPNYRQLLPQSHNTSVTLEADDMANALRRAGVVASSNPSVRLDVSDGSMTISASSPDQGDSTETIQVQTEGESVQIGLNYHYVLDGVDSMGGEVVLETQSPMQPAVFKCYGPINFLYLLMPVRL